MSSEDAELELGLGLGLSIGGGRPISDAGKPKPPLTSNAPSVGRILTAKDFPSSRAVSGTKRNADSVSHDGGSSPRVSLVGWPPVKASRMYGLVNNQAKTQRSEEQEKVVVCCDQEKTSNSNVKQKNKEQGNLGFVKVNIDGIAIGRKVDMSAHTCYDSLARTLQDMFFQPGVTLDLNGETNEEQGTNTPSKLLDGSSDFVLTYEDKDGDWMLVGDVPWRMFLGSVKRLRIMRTSEATGLAPRVEERSERQRLKPI